MAGWSSRNKLRCSAPCGRSRKWSATKFPLILSSVAVVMITGTLSLTKIVEAQSAPILDCCRTGLCSRRGFAGFVLFMIAANAEANRCPFDLPEGESEIVAGYFIEYPVSSSRLFLAEYVEPVRHQRACITLFLGGWNAPFAPGWFIPSWAWFFAKLITLVLIFIWTRGTCPGCGRINS